MAYKDTAKKTAYQNEYIKNSYDRINLTVAKGAKDCLKAIASHKGVSVNAMIRIAIDSTIRMWAEEIIDDNYDDYLHARVSIGSSEYGNLSPELIAHLKETMPPEDSIDYMKKLIIYYSQYMESYSDSNPQEIPLEVEVEFNPPDIVTTSDGGIPPREFKRRIVTSDS